MINHELLLAVLHYIGVDDTVLSFFQSYLSDRMQKVKISNNISTGRSVTCGVPQGSILGPTLYAIYTSEFYTSISNCKFHFYADDTQLYLTFAPESVQLACEKINEDLRNLITFSQDHCLKINAAKSNLLIFGNKKARLAAAPQLNLQVGDCQLACVDSARNLGLYMDSSLRFKLHITKSIQKAYGSLKALYSNREIFDKNLKIMLCNTLVLSHFNFCDEVYGSCLDQVDVNRIQRVQNSCLRFIYGVRKRDAISHKLAEANWLNMRNRRLSHACCLYFNIISKKTPVYLYERLRFRTDVHNLNLRYKGLLTPPMHKTTIFERSFSYNIAKAYNFELREINAASLPSLKIKLKRLLQLRQL